MASYVTKTGRLILECSDWYPGFLSRRIPEANRILENDDLMREIHSGKAGRPFQSELIDLVKSVPDDRTVNWVACFSGNSEKSKLTKYLVSAGLAISVSMDSSRSMSKTLILKARNYELIYGCPPPCVIIDQERQVRGDYLEGFYAILEGIKNGIVESGFQHWDLFSWGGRNVHVLVLSNTAPQYNFLSVDRYKVFEILPKELGFELRPAILEPILMKYDGRNVQYRYVSISADVPKIKKLQQIEKDIFSGKLGGSVDIGKFGEVSRELVEKEKGELGYLGRFDEISVALVEVAKENDEIVTSRNYVGLSAPITQSEFTIPENIRALVLQENERRNLLKEKSKKY